MLAASLPVIYGVEDRHIHRQRSCILEGTPGFGGHLPLQNTAAHTLTHSLSLSHTHTHTHTQIHAHTQTNEQTY